MAFVSAMVGPIVESLMGPVKRHLGYLFSSTDNLRTMEARMNELDRASAVIKEHKETNDRNTLEVPAGVPNWLEEVEKIKKEAQSISSNNNGSCFNLKSRYQVGRNSWKTTKKIQQLLEEGREIHWSDARKPLARVNTNRASTSAPSRGDDFKSRDTISKDALMFLQDHKTQVIALCGMGGVGKTTMMEQLKKVAKDKKMFDWIVKVVLGKQPKTVSIQQVVAETLSHSLTESEEETRAERLREVIEKILEKDKKGILVILDDVWENVELKDVGLSPLPNGVKLLLTSRDANTCRGFAVEAGNLHLEVLKVDVLEETEAHKFFCQITGVSEEHDPELYQIGGKIVKKCSYLPLAIKLIASSLKSESNSAIWRDRLVRLKKNGPHPKVHEIIEISYDNLKDDQEAKEIFLLCGLFPEDSNIRIEDLTRYAWGLQLLDGVSTLEDARDRTEACVSHLKNAHLLIDNDDPWYVKLHDLVLDFVLATVSKGDHASLIKHGDVSTWSPVEMSESYRRISLSCKGLPEFPKGFKSPNLSLLKVMNGDDSFLFPEDFYGNTKKLEVMAYEELQYPLLPRLLQCSTNLRMLCLHQCSLMFDFSSIGNLVNLEVLSFSHSTLRELPSSIGNLKKLKLLDLTGCDDLRGINDGVLKNLVKLEEIYMRNIEFTERNSNELAERSKNLLALEIKCFENKGQLKNMSYENLKRFKIYMGIFDRSWRDELKLFGNKLYLVTNKDELLESGMNGLLEKTEELCLEVDGMTNLEDIEVKSLCSPQYFSFCNLRSLMVSKCAELRYIFTLRVSTTLSKLEHLDISSCHFMQELIHIESSESETIKFPKLKFLSLYKLPNLLSLCNTINAIELPLLTDLRLDGLLKCTSIYPKKNLATSSIAINDSAWRPFLNEEFSFIYSRKIHLRRCDALSSVVPFNAVGKMQKLEELTIDDCDSLVEVFETQGTNNSGCCSTNFDEGSDTTLAIPRPKNINVPQLSNLKELDIDGCNLLQHVFTFATLESLSQLHKLKIERCEAMKVIVKEETDQEQTTPPKVVVFRRLKSITLYNLPTLTGFFLGMNEFRWTLLDEVKIVGCPQMMTFTYGRSNAPKLNGIHTKLGEHRLDRRGLNFNFHVMNNLHQTPCSILNSTSSYPITSEGICCSFHDMKRLVVEYNYGGKKIIPSKELLEVQKLEWISVQGCDSVEEVFEALEAGKDSGLNELPFVVKIPELREVELRELGSLKYIWKSKPWMVLEFPNLTKVTIDDCKSLEHVFTSSMVGSLLQLQELFIGECKYMEVIVKEENVVVGDEEEEGEGDEEEEGDDAKVNNEIIMLPRLKSLILYSLPSLKGFCLGNEAFSMPLLDTLKIMKCPAIRVFTKGHSATPQLKVIHTTFGRFEVREDQLNSFINTKQQETPCSSLDGRGWHPTTSEGIIRWSFNNLIEIDVKYDDDVEQIIPSKELLQVQNLERIHVYDCDSVKEVFEAGKDSGLSELPFVVKIPKLREVELEYLRRLKYIWKSYPWMVQEFPNLTKVYIHECKSLEHVFSSSMVGSLLQLQDLHILNCASMEVIVKEENFVIEDEEGDAKVNELLLVVKVPKLREVRLAWLDRLKYIWKSNPWMVLEFPNLTKVTIYACESLEHVFTSSMVGSLLQLQELFIGECMSMEVIVKEEEEEGDDAKVNNEIIMLPRLKSLQLQVLPRLKGCYLGKEAFSWPLLDALEITRCPAIRVFTKGHSATPQLKVIHTSFGMRELKVEEEEDQLNSFINTKQQEGLFEDEESESST